jgi:type II secretory pathway pseudopilin PulG
MRTTRRPRTDRGGFTIVEMLVAAVLVMAIMYLLSSCFAIALESFRKMKAVGDMRERLRAAGTTLQNDLTADHFDRYVSSQASGPRLSDQKMLDPYWQPPTDGFFRIGTGDSVNFGILEGTDADGNPSTRATNHVLSFTVKRPGYRREQFFASSILDPTPAVPNPVAARTLPQDFIQVGSFSSQWAEVAYYLWPTNTFAGGTPLYYLVRRERPLVPSVNGDPTIPQNGNYGDMSRTSLQFTLPYTVPGPYQQTQLFNTPQTASAPCRRMNVYNYAAPGSGDRPVISVLPTGQFVYDNDVLAGRVPSVLQVSTSNPGGFVPLAVALPGSAGEEIVLTDVISFEVKVAHDLVSPSAPEFPFDYLPACTAAANSALGAAGYPQQRVFDTWSTEFDSLPGHPTPLYDYRGWATGGTSASIPLRTRVRALQIRLRVWDFKTQQARQITFIQDV